MSPPPLKPDAASEANFQPLSASTNSCSSPILEPDRSALLQEALADSQLQAVKAQLERRGLSINADEAQAVQLAGGQQVLIPFGEDAHLVWTRANGQTAAVGLIRQGNKTLNISTTGEERIVRFLPMQKVEKLLRKLREKPKFQEFEGKLAQKGKRVGKVRALFDETNKVAILGIAAEGNDERIVHQVRIKVKPDKDDELEDDAEPAIQATACGQAVGAAVPMGAKLEPLALDPGDGGDLIGSSYDGSGGPDYGPQICTSQWGYDYHCTSRYPMLMVSTSSLTLPQTFINQQVQASFVVWNSGGGTLSGTVSVPAPFSIVSGSSFSLLPGQPQEVVVRFSSTTPGSFSKSIGISSNGGNTTVTVTGIAHKVSFSPAQLDFGSGLLVLREQCNDMGVCGLRTEKVGLPIEKALTVKNEGTVAVTLTLSTAAPYKIVSVLPTLSPGQSGQVTVRFDPNESGNFTGSVQVGIQDGQGSVNSSPLVGVAHKIEIQPAELNFGIAIVGTTKEQKLTVKNQGVTTVTVDVPNTVQNTTSPFRVVLESPLVLGPSESKEISVELSPIESGQFTGIVRLSISQALLEIPATAKAYTEEEYREILKQTILATCQATEASQGARNTYFVPGLNQDFLFYRMPCPTDEELDNLLQMILDSQDPPTDNSPVLEGFDFDPEKVILALSQILNDPNGPYQQYLQTVRSNPTNEVAKSAAMTALINSIASIASQNRDLAEFLKALAYVDGQELGRWILNMVTVLTYMDPMFGGIIRWVLTAWSGISNYLSSLGPNPPSHSVSYGLTVLLLSVMYEYPQGESAVAAVLRHGSGFDRVYALKAIISIATFAQLYPTERYPYQFIGSGLNVELANLFMNRIAQAFSTPDFRTGPLSVYLSRYVKALGFYGDNANILFEIALGNPVVVENYSNNVGGFIAFVALAAFVDESGRRWDINAVPAVGLHSGFGLTDPGLNANVHLIASKTILVNGIERRVTVFVHVEAKLGVSEVGQVAGIIERMTRSAIDWIKSLRTTPGLGLGEPVTVLIVFSVENDPATGESAVDKLKRMLQTKQLSTPVLILYPKDGGWTWEILGGDPNDPSYQQFLNAVAAALAQALSTPYSGGSENTLLQLAQKMQQAIQIALALYPELPEKVAINLVYGVCGGDIGCILMIAESYWWLQGGDPSCQEELRPC